MIAIDNKLVSDEIVEKQFVCDLDKCKGGCCEDGDAGAPLDLSELDELIHNYEVIKPYLTPEGIKAIEQQGKYHFDREFGWVTPTIKGEMCAYGYKDKNGIIKCGIETAFNEGKLKWKKPISCHLFPIRTKKSTEDRNLEYLNYEPRHDLCKAACKLGKRLQVPVYVFLKDALIRKYGEDFYKALEAAALYVEEK
ncbi:MAG TPA: DUF3109 family protein [Parafilimonas sp.]|nr:DUF3109 family protein [Parafilimonas sp.]